MKIYNNIYSKIYDIENLILAHKMASKDKSHYKEIIEFNKDKENNLLKIQQLLLTKSYKDITYTPQIKNDRGKERILMKLSYYPHRIIQWAIMLQCEKIFVNYFCSHSCASVKGRGTSRAVILLQRYLYKTPLETTYCLKIDVKQFYPSINKEILCNLLKEKFIDKDLLWLFKIIIDSYPDIRGIPIGSYLSQYFANFYLTKFDWWLKQIKQIKYCVRYMDDIVILHHSKEFLHNLRKEIQQYWKEKLDLTMKENYQVFPIKVRGVDFVGYRVYHTHTLLRTRNRNNLRAKCKSIRKKIRQNRLINKNDFFSLNSRVGFFRYCNHKGLFTKYIEPYIPTLTSYYKNILVRSKKRNKELATTKYIHKLYSKMLNKKGICSTHSVSLKAS